MTTHRIHPITSRGGRRGWATRHPVKADRPGTVEIAFAEPGRTVVPMTNTRPCGGVATAPHQGFDVDRARRETPGTRRVAHLNNAGAALPPAPVTDAVNAHLRRESRSSRMRPGPGTWPSTH